MDILIEFLILTFLLFFIPQMLSGLKIPMRVSEILLGMLFGPFLLNYFISDDLVRLMSTLGIISLFLFAGLELDTRAMKGKSKIFAENIVLQAALIIIAAVAVQNILQAGYVVSGLVSLAILSPSAGFILSHIRSTDSISGNEEQRVKYLAISTEIFALILLFGLTSFSNAGTFIASAAAILIIIIALPKLVRKLHPLMLKLPTSHFSFVMLLAILVAYVTEYLGVHYLIGAFIVGLTTRRELDKIIESAPKVRKMIFNMENFAAFFIPFYFFGAGLSVPRELLSRNVLLPGIALSLIVIILRAAAIVAHRKWRFGERISQSLRTAMFLTPTTVFTLVVATILLQKFGISKELFGMLVLYALLTSIIPAFVRNNKILRKNNFDAAGDGKKPGK